MPTFIIPKKEGTVRFISDFREVNKRIVRTPYPIPKIATILQEMEGFTYATSLDLNMGYYTQIGGENVPGTLSSLGLRTLSTLWPQDQVRY